MAFSRKAKTFHRDRKSSEFKNMTTKIFLHGLESSNQGTKSVYFRERFPDMIIPTFTGDLDQRMKKLKQLLAGKSDLILVGSSFGGLMAALYAVEHNDRIKRLILLAPALNWIGSHLDPLPQINVPAWIYHGQKDTVVPLKPIKKIAEKIFPDLTFTVLEDDHVLHRTFKQIDWLTHLNSDF
jgi:pimeloyl-ACP methyl ester carboxylesterase